MRALSPLDEGVAYSLAFHCSILNLQVARAALKTLGSVRANPSTKLSPSSAYLASLGVSTSRTVSITDASSWLSRPLQLQVISLRAALQVERLERLLASGKPFSKLSWECVAVSKAIVEAFLVSRMIAALDDGGLLVQGAGPAERKVMETLIHFVSSGDSSKERFEERVLTNLTCSTA